MQRTGEMRTSPAGRGGPVAATAVPSRGFNLALGLFLGLLALYSVLQSPLFEVDEVEVRGARRLTPEEIAAVTGIVRGSNLFALDLVEARRRLERLPVIVSAEVRRGVFPPRVVVSLVERVPVAYLSTEEGFWAIDVQGVALFLDEGLTLSLPLVTASTAPVAAAGTRVEAPHLNAALRFVDALSAEGKAFLTEVRLGPDGVVVYTEDRVTVRLGAGEEMAERARVLEGLLQQFASRGTAVAEIDLRHPKNPVFIERR